MSNPKKAKYTSFLPPTPCTEAMRSQILEVAKAKGESMAEIQREALTLFLKRNYNNIIVQRNDVLVLEELSR